MGDPAGQPGALGPLDQGQQHLQGCDAARAGEAPALEGKTPVRQDRFSGNGSIAGTVSTPSTANDNPHDELRDPPTPVQGALVHACSLSTCRITQTDSNGAYRITGLGDHVYRMRALPPPNSNLNPGDHPEVLLDDELGWTRTGVDFVLTPPMPPPNSWSESAS